jgi:DNA-directed RNA polymerase specialized sigma24 family protein
MRLCFQPEDAGELVEAVFVTIMASLDRFEGRGQMRTWPFGILHHKMRERSRAITEDAKYDPIDEDFESHVDEHGRWRLRPSGPDHMAVSRGKLRW